MEPLPNRPFGVCLINAPVLGVLEPWYDTPPFVRTALAYLAGYLRQYDGFDIHIIDAKFERLGFDEVAERVKKLNPKVVGITAFTNEIKPAAYQAALIKRRLPGVTVVVGGPHVTALPEETLLEFKPFDIGVIGEGEITFYELCEALRQGDSIDHIPGLSIKKGRGGVLQTPPRERILDQDSIPLPAWDLMPKAHTYFIQSVRGCPYNCSFCMNPGGKVARKRSVENVMQEIRLLIRDFAPKRISYGDELFSVDIPRTHALLDAMIAEDVARHVSWDVQTHVNYVNRELFKKFRRAGVERVELGIETGDETALKKMGKGTGLDDIKKACDAAREEGVKIGTFFLFGQPNETTQSLQKTVDLAVKINPHLPMFGLMTPYPGTEVAKRAVNGEYGYRLLTTDWDQYNKQIGGALTFANLTRKQLEWFQVKAYLKVYIYNGRFWDLAKFLFEYRKGAWEVLKKIMRRSDSITAHFQLPADYEASIYEEQPMPPEALATARDLWAEWQNRELKRYKTLAKGVSPS